MNRSGYRTRNAKDEVNLLALGKESGSIDYFRTTGLEVEARAAVHRTVSFTGAYTWQRPEQLNIPFLLGIPPSMVGVTPQNGYGGRFVGLADIFNVTVPVRVVSPPLARSRRSRCRATASPGCRSTPRSKPRS